MIEEGDRVFLFWFMFFKEFCDELLDFLDWKKINIKYYVYKIFIDVEGWIMKSLRSFYYYCGFLWWMMMLLFLFLVFFFFFKFILLVMYFVRGILKINLIGWCFVENDRINKMLK